VGYGEWLHGEAVAAGMVLASELSRRVAGLPASDAMRLAELLRQARLPVAPPSIPFERWVEFMARDKKSAGGAMRFILLRSLGDAFVATRVAEQELAAILS
jgi:3-dehydroquinate synthase